MEVVVLLPIAPLRAALPPKTLTSGWPTHGGLPFVAHSQAGVSSAMGSGNTGVTPSEAPALGALPQALLTITEYDPACANCTLARVRVAELAPLTPPPLARLFPFRCH